MDDERMFADQKTFREEMKMHQVRMEAKEEAHLERMEALLD
jgi:hypothetical protein